MSDQALAAQIAQTIPPVYDERLRGTDRQGLHVGSSDIEMGLRTGHGRRHRQGAKDLPCRLDFMV